MKETVETALNTCQILGADYADVRVIESRSQRISVKNGSVEAVASSQSVGFGVRLLADGAWGFAASFDLGAREVELTARLAHEIALASAPTVKNRTVLGRVEPVAAEYRTPVEIDPFSVPLEDKIKLLLSIDETIRETEGVTIANSSMSASNKKQLFGSTEGALISQEITSTGAGISATAVKDGEVQVRSYPNSHGGQFGCKGYELIDELALDQHAARIAAEAVALHHADTCPSKTTAVVLGSSQMALQIHESIGHPTELDRVVGMEASFAGTSFLTLDKLDKFRVGSDLVTISADATVPGALGTFGFDDEGVPAQNTPIISRGLLAGYLSSRETAHLVGGRSNGTMRADGWNRIPLIRMTNLNLDPGEGSLDEIVSETPEGVLFETNRSWSIDDKRLNFQFASEIGWEIKNGKLGRMLKNPNYTGVTPKFWAACDRIAGPGDWRMWGVPNCGKGEPTQIARVGHGSSPARFQDTQIGVGK